MENVKNICENTRQLLEEKFGNIQFIEEGHEYFIENEKYYLYCPDCCTDDDVGICGS